jgi:hypothetical protein
MSSLYVKGVILLVLMAFCVFLFAVGLIILAYVIWDAIYRTFFVNYAEWHTYDARVTERKKTEASTTYVPMSVGRTIVMNGIHNPEEYTVWVELIRGSDRQPADAANLLFGWSHVMYGKELYEAVEEGDVIEVLARVGYSKLSGKAKCTDIKLPYN